MCLLRLHPAAAPNFTEPLEMAPQRHQPQSSQALPRLPYSLSAPGLTQVPGGFVPAPRNTKTFDRNELVLALNHLSSLIAPTFQGQKVTLFAHGGAVMVLHLGLGARQTTRDVNVCLREFNKEWSFKGVENAENKLRWCITKLLDSGDWAPIG